MIGRGEPVGFGMVPTRRLSVRLASLLAVLAAGGGIPACKAGARLSREGGERRDGATGLAPRAPGDDDGLGNAGTHAADGADLEARPVAEVEAGGYEADERFAALAAGFADRASEAAVRLEAMTGLSFRDRAPPRVVLVPLSDERRPHAVSQEIAGGRRRAVVRVNPEAVLAHGDDLDRALRRALAHAAVVAERRAGPPPWFVAFAAALSGGDLADKVERVVRRAAMTGSEPRVDPADPAAAEATGLAAGLLLAARVTPLDVRRLVTLVADGDDPSPLLARWIADPEGQWSGAARGALAEATDPAWRREGEALRLAKKALLEAGPEGLAQALDARVADLGALSEDFEAEARALRVAAAVAAGDGDLARTVLGQAPPEGATLARLADPGAYVLDAARAEELTRGDPVLAFALYERFRRDFPAHPAASEARAGILRLIHSAPPELKSRIVRTAIEGSVGDLDAKTSARWVHVLLADHRPGAARRFLASLGRRADDPDLDEARRQIVVGEGAPTASAREEYERRVAAWLERPDPARGRDVLDSGPAAAEILSGRLPPPTDPRRAEAIRLLVRVAGPIAAARLASPGWTSDPGLLGHDLKALARIMDYRTFSDSLQQAYPALLTDPRARAEWSRVTFGLSPAWLDQHPGVLESLHSAKYGERRAAFDEVVAAGLASEAPAFLREFASDPAILLRRQAVLVAGKTGPLAVVLEAFSDASWVVRKAACAAAGEARAREAIPPLLGLLDADPDPRVRAAAAEALFEAGPGDPAAVSALVAAARTAEPELAGGIAVRLPSLPPPLVLPAIVRALRREAARTDAPPGRAALLRLFLAYRRATGVDPGYDPTVPIERVRAIIESLPEAANAGIPPRPQ